MRRQATMLPILLLAFGTAAAGSQLRTWFDSTGKHSTQAVLLEQEGEEVKLRRRDGQIVSVPLAKLSLEDRLYVRAQSAPASVRRFLEHVADLNREIRISRERELAECEKEIKRLDEVLNRPSAELRRLIREEKIAPVPYARRNAVLKRLIEDSERKRAELEKRKTTLAQPRIFLPGLNPRRLAVGQSGVLVGQFVRVLQILGPSKMLVTYDSGQLGELGEPMLIQGVPTHGLVDGSHLSDIAIYLVTGTYQYQSVAGGVKTVFKLEALDAFAYLDGLPWVYDPLGMLLLD